MRNSLQRIVFAVCFVGSALLPALAHAEKSFILSSYHVVSADREQLTKVAEHFEVIRRANDRYEIYVPLHQTRVFRSLLPQARLIHRDIRHELNSQLLSLSTYSNGYHTYEEVVSLLKELQARHPNIARLEVYGNTGQGTPLYALKLSDNVQSEESHEKNLMITAATHGDELLSTEVFLHLITELVAGYPQEPRLKKLIDQNALHLIPVVNPDGFISRERYADGVDPNRDFPYPGNPHHTSIPTVAALISFAHKYRVEGVMDIHNYGGLILYPWGYNWSPINDPAMMQKIDQITKAMAAQNGYDIGQISRVMFFPKGCSSDYYYWKLNAVALGVEIGANSKAPPPHEIPQYVDDAREMTWRFIESFE
jgi:hypothetical protein